MEKQRIITISELLRNGEALTGASSISHCRNDKKISEKMIEKSIPDKFHALDFPAFLVGVIDLSADESCLSFSDETGRIFCDILSLNLGIIGREISVLAWNFIPLSADRGVLEIIRWESPNLSLSQFPDIDVCQRVRSCVWGVLSALSSVFLAPFSDQSAFWEGFLAEIHTCNCHICENSKSVGELEQNLIDLNPHNFEKPVFVCFHGQSSSWRPIISKLQGNLVTISGLKKKYISSGESERLVFVTTEKTVVYKHERRSRFHSKRGSQLGSYCGVVTGIFNDGMVVELDGRNVWLLLAALHVNLPHSLRIGALIIVKNVHLIRPNFAWIKMLLLGSSIRTTIEVKSFSVVDTRCYLVPRGQHHLWNFVNSLPHQARFWAILVISSFQKKFAGVLSEKEILGTRKKEGLVEKFCKFSLPLDKFQIERGAFEEFCGSHDCSLRNSSKDVPLMMAVPLSNFIAKCMKHWVSTATKMDLESKTNRGKGQTDQFRILRKYHQWMSTQTISSEEVGVLLFGFLQVSHCSGRLRLVDSTGAVDVVICPLQRHIDPRDFYEVKEYKIVMNGFPLVPDPGIFHSGDPLSCRSIFQEFEASKEDHNLHISVHIEARHLRSLGVSSPDRTVPIDRTNSGVFDMLLVTHKFPKILGRKNGFAEAVLLPYSLIIKQHRQESTQGVPCLITFTGAGTTHEAYLSPKDKVSDSLRRILLEFEPEFLYLHQRLCIGKPYISKRPGNVTLPVDSIKSQVNSLWSIDLHQSSDSSDGHVETRLHLSEDWIARLGVSLAEARAMMGEILTVSALLQTRCGTLSLKGKLVSLRGDIKEIHRARECHLCVHLCEGDFMIKVRGSPSESFYPFRLGPGANATFHRVLAQPNSAGRYDLVMVPVSIVVVNYVQWLETPPQPSDSITGMRSRAMISELCNLAVGTTVDLHCRVAGAFFLALECPRTWQSAVSVPLAGFLLDDGSALCCCWADSGRARTMLHVKESLRESLKTGEDSSPVNVGRNLRRILTKHLRVTVNTFGSISSGSGADVVDFDQRVLKQIVILACHGPSLNVAARLLSAEALTCLGEGFPGSDPARESLKHVWAEAVDHACAFSEARNLINELL